METQTRFGAGGSANGQCALQSSKGTATRVAHADAFLAVLDVSLKKLVRPDFDALAWADDLILSEAGVFSVQEYHKVVTVFNGSPLSLLESKLTAKEAKRHPGTHAAWKQRFIDSEVAFISDSPFPCQKPGPIRSSSVGEVSQDVLVSLRSTETFYCRV